jgi:hypothetical protein
MRFCHHQIMIAGFVSGDAICILALAFRLISAVMCGQLISSRTNVSSRSL